MKKIIIITIVALLVTGAGIFLAVNKSGEQSIPEKKAGEPVPALPGFANSETLPISDSENQAEIKDQFQKTVEEPVSAETEKEKIKWFSVKDANGKIIPLRDFLKANEAKIHPKVESLLAKNDYEIFYCPDEKKEKDFGIALYANPDGFYPDRYSDMTKLLKEWEETVLSDFHSIVFPDMNFTASDLQQKIAFREGKYRFAEVILPDGRKSSINYENFGDAVVLTTSMDCLDTVSSVIAPLQN